MACRTIGGIKALDLRKILLMEVQIDCKILWVWFTASETVRLYNTEGIMDNLENLQ